MAGICEGGNELPGSLKASLRHSSDFGPICNNFNKELRDIYKDPDIIALIKSRRLRLLGHVLRRDEDFLLRKAFDYSPRCKRPLGRPRLRWQDQVYDNLCTVGGRQEDAENRDEWRYIVALHGCETWTLSLREEQRLRVFENKVLRKMFGAKRDEVPGEWRKLHNTELHALYSSTDIIRNIKSRRLRWAGHVARMVESRNAYRVLVRRPEGKRPLGRPRRRWEDNIKMDLRDVGYDDRDWINLAQ
ncbi:hypothetical protein ANN_06080 [Periplaneta americana]|uniref:Uncharacterized protein n=1 Tax=Periplaneta americana TaxID=6978 RepID=A0ABQ8TEB5_PERAM|nr:hypothetical protein ANN_06080 [Periplaneta americana]